MMDLNQKFKHFFIKRKTQRILDKVGTGIKKMLHRKQHLHLDDLGISEIDIHKVNHDVMKNLCATDKAKLTALALK